MEFKCNFFSLRHYLVQLHSDIPKLIEILTNIYKLCSKDILLLTTKNEYKGTLHYNYSYFITIIFTFSFTKKSSVSLFIWSNAYSYCCKACYIQSIVVTNTIQSQLRGQAAVGYRPGQELLLLIIIIFSSKLVSSTFLTAYSRAKLYVVGTGICANFLGERSGQIEISKVMHVT
jgi:hypothetical protein